MSELSELTVYLAAATALLALHALAARGLEGRWLSPALVFSVAFVAHAFVAPIHLLRIDYPTLLVDTLPHTQAFSLLALAAVVAGYIGAQLFLRGQPAAALSAPAPQRQSSLALAGLAACLALSVAYLLASDGLSEGKGALAYSPDPSWGARLAAVANASLPPLVLYAAMLLQQLHGDTRAIAKGSLLVAVAVVVVVSLVTFARQQLLVIVLLVVIFHHFRVRSIGARGMAVALALLLLADAFSHLRAFAAGILTISDEEIASTLGSAFESFSDPLSAVLRVGSVIAGQEVFTQVVDLVPASEPFRYGSTYLDSLLGMLAPRVLTGDYQDIQTPAYWFKDVFAPYVVGHGYDFSMLSEAYLNFGDYGVLVFLPVGALVALASRLITRSGSLLCVAWATVALVALVTGLRTDSNALFKTLFFPMLPVLAIYLVSGQRALGRGALAAAPER